MKHIFIRTFILFLLASTSVFSGVLIIPKPVKVEERRGHFTITPQTKIVYYFANKDVKPTAEYLAKQLRRATGYKLPLINAMNTPKENYIFLNFTRDEDMDREGYQIDVQMDRIDIEANQTPGFFYGVQSLFQLLPVEIYANNLQRSIHWEVPCVYIFDRPRFAWRGMHLDVSRHFFPKEFIKTYIDMIAMHKMNIFHWHLCDDQGWRIEIKKYPKLTSIGAWRVDREDQPWNSRDPQRKDEKATYGGYYTQREIKEIVKYAAARNVTIVPEIEMPAHTVAALAAYPQFSCKGGPFTVPSGGVWPDADIYCAGNDSTFYFLENILGEVIALFPGKYIHIGGDEADKTEWKKCPKCQARIQKEYLKDESELQSYFIKRIEKFLISKKRSLIGWDEILEGGLAPDATVMSWRGIEGGIAAAKQDHDCVMTPGSHCYFDRSQGNTEYEPAAIGGYTPLSKVYQYEPVPDGLTPEQAKHILGAQANVWTEFIPTSEHVQYMTMPRMAAMAEVLWSAKESRNWNDFTNRIEHQLKRYDVLNLNYAKSVYLVSFETQYDSVKKKMVVTLANEMNKNEIRYTLDGSNPAETSFKYEQPFTVEKSLVIKAATFKVGKPLSGTSEQKLFLHKALFKPIAMKYPFKKYSAGGNSALVNARRGSISFNDGNWQGYEQDDLDAVIDLGENTTITNITTNFIEDTRSWIFFPSKIDYAYSGDGVSFTPFGTFENPACPAHHDAEIKKFAKSCSNIHARYIQVKAKNVGTVPDWHIGKGGKAWLFVDEIIVE